MRNRVNLKDRSQEKGKVLIGKDHLGMITIEKTRKGKGYI